VATQHLCPASPLARGSVWAGGRDHTPSRVPQRWVYHQSRGSSTDLLTRVALSPSQAYAAALMSNALGAAAVSRGLGTVELLALTLEVLTLNINYHMVMWAV
jgi:hypothetical protein